MDLFPFNIVGTMKYSELNRILKYREQRISLLQNKIYNNLWGCSTVVELLYAQHTHQSLGALCLLQFLLLEIKKSRILEKSLQATAQTKTCVNVPNCLLPFTMNLIETLRNDIRGINHSKRLNYGH